MLTYQTVVATREAQVHREAWAQAGVEAGCVDQRCARDSTHLIRTKAHGIRISAMVNNATRQDVVHRLPLLESSA